MKRTIASILFIAFVFALIATSSAVAARLGEDATQPTTTSTTLGGTVLCTVDATVDPDNQISVLIPGVTEEIPVQLSGYGVFDMFVDDGGAGGKIACDSSGNSHCLITVTGGGTVEYIDYTPPVSPTPTITITAILEPHSVGFTCLPGSSGGTSSKTYLTDDLSDFDIASFRVSKKASVSKKKSVVKIELGVENQAQETSPRPATVQGMQNQVEVYNETVDVSDEPGKRATTFRFPDYRPLATGTIDWTATILDGDPDQDVATAVTKVTP